MKKVFAFFTTIVTLILFSGLQNAANAENHAYYKGLTRKQAEQADFYAQGIAEYVMATPAFKTDFERVSAAAKLVYNQTKIGVYGFDTNKYYRSPYGVFISRNYTCAGTTRAMGRVLDFMGFKWKHVNPNKYLHQWNILVMDGKVGWVDGMTGETSYGNRCDTDPRTWIQFGMEGVPRETCR